MKPNLEPNQNTDEADSKRDHWLIVEVLKIKRLQQQLSVRELAAKARVLPRTVEQIEANDMQYVSYAELLSVGTVLGSRWTVQVFSPYIGPDDTNEASQNPPVE